MEKQSIKGKGGLKSNKKALSSIFKIDEYEWIDDRHNDRQKVKILNIDLGKLELSTRVYHCFIGFCKELHMPSQKLGDILKLTSKELLTARNMGQKSLKETNDYFRKEYGVSIRKK